MEVLRLYMQCFASAQMHNVQKELLRSRGDFVFPNWNLGTIFGSLWVIYFPHSAHIGRYFAIWNLGRHPIRANNFSLVHTVHIFGRSISAMSWLISSFVLRGIEEHWFILKIFFHNVTKIEYYIRVKTICTLLIFFRNFWKPLMMSRIWKASLQMKTCWKYIHFSNKVALEMWTQVSYYFIL